MEQLSPAAGEQETPASTSTTASAVGAVANGKPNGSAAKNTKPKQSRAARRKRTMRIHRGVRWAVQLGFFLVAPAVFSAAFNGAKYLFTQLGARQPVEASAFLVLLVAVLAFTIVFGRFFCGYACAFGTLGDAVYALLTPVRRLLRIPAKPLPDAAVRALQFAKFAVLAAICALCFAGAWSAVSGYSPWTAFAAIIAGSLDGVQAGALAVLGAIVVGMAFIERFFCQFLCPLGALFALMPVLPFSAYSRNRERCGKSCGLCKKGCPVTVFPDAESFAAGECIACGRCADVCPLENVALVRLGQDGGKDGSEPSEGKNANKAKKAGLRYKGTGIASVLMRAALLLALLGACGALSGCANSSTDDAGSAQQSASEAQASEKVQTRTLFVFDTVVQLSAQCSPELMDQLAERCEYFERTLSRTVEGSDIWNINCAGGAPVEVSEETAQIIRQALEYSEASDGLFDITIGAVSSLWDFSAGTRPSDEELAAALPHVDYHAVRVEGTTVTLTDPEAKLDLGGIAKGFIADDLARLLRENGCENASLSLGGNVYVLGESYDGDAWNVGVQDPNGSSQSVIASIPARDASVVTSGLYERSFEEGGVLYHHILDPRTGMPVETDLVSASIVSASSTDGDAYSTILFLLGHDKALELVESDERFQALLVDDAGNVTASAGSGFTIITS